MIVKVTIKIKEDTNYLLVLVILDLHDNFGNAMCLNSSSVNFTFTITKCGDDVISCIKDKTANLTRGDCVNVFLEGGNHSVMGSLTIYWNRIASVTIYIFIGVFNMY